MYNGIYITNNENTMQLMLFTYGVESSSPLDGRNVLHNRSLKSDTEGRPLTADISLE